MLVVVVVAVAVEWGTGLAGDVGQADICSKPPKHPWPITRHDYQDL